MDAAAPVATPVAGHEREIALDLARRAAILAPVAMLVAGLLEGWAGVLGAAAGMAVVAGNFWFLARAMEWGARISPTAVAGAAMLGYLVLILAVTLLAVAARELDVVDVASFVLTIAIAHLVLLVWQLPSIGLTLGAPGLKPRPLAQQGPAGATPRSSQVQATRMQATHTEANDMQEESR